MGEVQISDKGILIECGGKGHLLAWSTIQRCEFNGGENHELLLKCGEDPKTWCARLPSNSSDSSEWTIPFHAKPEARQVVGLGIVAVIAGLVAVVFIDNDERRLVWLIRFLR